MCMSPLVPSDALCCYVFLGLALETMAGRSLWPGDPIPCRDDLARAAQKYFNETGWAAEVGVYQGRFAAHNMRHWKGRYFMIDAWAHRPFDDSSDKNFPQAEHEENLRQARARVRFARGRGWPIRGFSLDVAQRFADGSLDWVFIDALHVYEATLRDLEAGLLNPSCPYPLSR